MFGFHANFGEIYAKNKKLKKGMMAAAGGMQVSQQVGGVVGSAADAQGAVMGTKFSKFEEK